MHSFYYCCIIIIIVIILFIRKGATLDRPDRGYQSYSAFFCPIFISSFPLARLQLWLHSSQDVLKTENNSFFILLVF